MIQNGSFENTTGGQWNNSIFLRNGMQVVEDSTAGVAAGRAAGMHIIGVDRQSSCQQDFSGCDWLVHDLSELDVKAEFGEDVGLKEQAKRHARTLIDRIVLRGPK